MAFVSTSEDGGLQFASSFADFLRKQPYYQCGLAMNDLLNKKVRTDKFTSIGELK